MSSAYSSVRSSPIPDLAYDSYKSLGLRDQTLIKRQLSNNLEGTPPPNSLEQQHQLYQGRSTQQQHGNDSTVTRRITNPSLQHHLMKMSQNPYDYVTVQGATYALSPYSGETLLFWILLGVLIILVAVNLALTLAIFGTLRIGVGMESIEAFPTFIKFFGSTDLDEIYKRDGIIEGFLNEPIEIETVDDLGQLNFRVHDGSQPTLSLEKNSLNISQVDELNVSDMNNNLIFSTTNPTLNVPYGIKNFDVKSAQVNKITSDVNSTLELVSTRFTTLKGSEGTKMEAKEIQWIADHDLILKSNDKITLSGNDGLHIYRYSLPLVDKDGVTRNFYTLQTNGKKESQYKLCICMPEGKLFRIQIPVGNSQNLNQVQRIGCHSAIDPCS